MKLKKQLPELELVLTNTDEFTVNLLISIMKNLGVPVHESSQEYDPEYPHLIWDGENVSQSRTTYDRQPVNTIEEFVKHFTEMPSRTIKLTDDYNITISADNVKVGCQEIPFEKLKEVWDTMSEIRNM